MKSPDYKSRIVVPVTAERAALCVSHVAGWWATNFTGSSGRINDQFTVRFGKTFAVFGVIELVANEKIVWAVRDCYLPLFKNKTQWNGTAICWELSPVGGATEITMTHIGLTPAIECYPDCEKGWNFYTTESLYQFITTGKGFPGTGIFANLVIEDRKYEGVIYCKDDPLPQYPEGYLIIDVMETIGEQVTGVHSASTYDREQFDAGKIKGHYFMIVENKPVRANISLQTDVLHLMRNNTNSSVRSTSVTKP